MKKEKDKKSYRAVKREEEAKYRIKPGSNREKKYGAKYYVFFILRVLYRILLIIVAVALVAVFGVSRPSIR